LTPRPAQYLLRFDDLCPTFSLPRWERFRGLIEGFGIRPILAVVPDNRDPELMVADPDTSFWMRMRALERGGATIGLHGWQHACRSNGRSLNGPCRRTEFAGVDEETQRAWIAKGIATLRNEGLSPRIWVAPRHGTDHATLRVLKRAGIEYISDGLARIPFLRGEMRWIPQQLWGPEEHRSGVWTICVHSNTAAERDLDRLRGFVKTHASQFSSLERIEMEFRFARLGLLDRIEAGARATRMAIRARRKSQAARGISLMREPTGPEIGFAAEDYDKELPTG